MVDIVHNLKKNLPLRYFKFCVKFRKVIKTCGEQRIQKSQGSDRGVPVGQCIQHQHDSYSEDPVFLSKNDE